MIRIFIDILLLSFTIFGEASGESLEGKIAVGSVIRNRTIEYNKTYPQIILKKNQFSCWNSNEVMKHIKRLEYKPFKECLIVAIGIYSNNIKDNTEGSLYYVKLSVVKSWMKEMRIVLIYDNHKFMIEK